MRPLRILTWHVHGNYLYYLSQANVEFYLPVAPGRPGFGGRGGTFPFPERVRDIPAESVRDLDLDCILFQTEQNYTGDQYWMLSKQQQMLPKIYLEHDPPQKHPTNTEHPVDDPRTLLVHVTPFNELMWDSGRTPTKVIEHGVFVPEKVRYTGELAKGIVVVNHLRRRGRRLGTDVFEEARRWVPLDLVGMDAEALGGIGEIQPLELAQFEARYRFFFNPIRYTSLGLAVIEAMMVGLPVIGLATTEMATVIENGVSGFVSTDLNRLIEAMRGLLGDPSEALRQGNQARRTALERFSIERFTREWEETFTIVAGRPVGERALVAPGFGVSR